MMLSFLCACAKMTKIVSVSHEQEVALDGAPLSMHLTYQASKIDHPPSYRVSLEENPMLVKMYNAPVLVGIDGGPHHLSFHLPSPYQWHKPEKFWDDWRRGWVIVERGKLRFFFGDTQ
jgi:hypothetical protein